MKNKIYYYSCRRGDPFDPTMEFWRAPNKRIADEELGIGVLLYEEKCYAVKVTEEIMTETRD